MALRVALAGQPKSGLDESVLLELLQLVLARVNRWLPMPAAIGRLGEDLLVICWPRLFGDAAERQVRGMLSYLGTEPYELLSLGQTRSAALSAAEISLDAARYREVFDPKDFLSAVDELANGLRHLPAGSIEVMHFG
jgi:hypothetical protein